MFSRAHTWLVWATNASPELIDKKLSALLDTLDIHAEGGNALANELICRPWQWLGHVCITFGKEHSVDG